MSKVIELQQKTKGINRIHAATKAMQVAAAAQLKSIQSRQRAAFHFKKHFTRLAARLEIDKLVTTQKNARPLVKAYVLTSQRGFCGGFNEQVVTAANKFLAEQKSAGRQVELMVLGNKGAEHGAKLGPTAKLEYTDNFGPALLKDMSDRLLADCRLWLEGEAEKIVIISNEFVSMLVQRPRAFEVLPFDLSAAQTEPQESLLDLPLETVVDNIVLGYVRAVFYGAAFQSFLGEVAARLLTMRGATENSKDMLKHLHIRLNKARQSMITIELSEIISAFETLEEEIS